VKHVKFWWHCGHNISSQKGIWGKERPETILCAASAATGVVVTGSDKGTLLVWKNFKVCVLLALVCCLLWW
jgi:hypothetical protein